MNTIKIAAVAASAALAMAALAGCGSQPAPSNANSNSAPTQNTTPAQNSTSTQNTTPAQNTTPTQNSTPSAASQDYIGEQAAKDIALAQAGFAASDVQELKAELDYDTPVHYDVDFKQGGQEYDYDIDAVTGAVITAHSEVDD